MPVQKFRDAREMPPPQHQRKAQPWAAIRALWARSHRLAGGLRHVGVTKFRSVEEMHEHHERFVIERMRRLAAQRGAASNSR